MLSVLSPLALSHMLRCALVSSSDELIGSRAGRAIDAHDVVIRLNFALTMGRADYRADVGSRTDMMVVNWPSIMTPGYKQKVFFRRAPRSEGTSGTLCTPTTFANNLTQHTLQSKKANVPLVVGVDPAMVFTSNERFIVTKTRQGHARCRRACIRRTCCCTYITDRTWANVLHDVRSVARGCRFTRNDSSSLLRGSPSTGMISLVLALHACRSGSVTLFGFSKRHSTGKHYYMDDDTIKASALGPFGRREADGMGPHNYTCERTRMVQWSSNATALRLMELDASAQIVMHTS